RLMPPTAAQPAAPLHLHAQGERHQYEKDEEQTTAATGSRVVHGAWSQERKGFVLTASLSHVQYVQRIAERVGRLRQLEGAREDIRFQPTTCLLTCGRVSFAAVPQDVETRLCGASINQPVFGYSGSPIEFTQVYRVFGDAGFADDFQHHLRRTVQLQITSNCFAFQAPH